MNCMDRAPEELSQSRRTGQTFNLLLIDVDHFKRINDTHGHASGDEARRYTSPCVRQALRDDDVFWRQESEGVGGLFSASLTQCS